jgi:peptidoglycan/LPS O-acetylase OafA/YrhL
MLPARLICAERKRGSVNVLFPGADRPVSAKRSLGQNSRISHAPHIPSLDGFRALSVALVFLAHAGLDAMVPGGFGVTIFFFLSGFLITSLMRMEHMKNGRVNFAHFWLRRVLRILPPFYLVLAGATLATWLLAPAGSLAPTPIIAQSLHVTNYWVIVHGYVGMPIGTGVYWSLAVEEHFYLAFPWLYVGMQKAGLAPRSQALVLWSLCAAILAWRVLLVLHAHPTMERTYMGTDTRIDSILYGCALAVWCNPVLDAPILDEKWWKWLVLPGALLVLVFCVVYRGGIFRETLRYSLQGVALTPLMIAAIRFRSWWLFRPLNWRPVAFLGVLSYSFYLVHFVVISAIQETMPGSSPFLQGVMALVLAIALSWAIYWLVERPCARLRRRLTD